MVQKPIRTVLNGVVTPATIKKILQAKLFDVDWYAERYPDVRKSGLDPLSHFFRFGEHLGRDPNPFFSTKFYREQTGAGSDIAVLHYLENGVSENLDPHPEFSTSAYLRSHSDVARTGINPLVHYLKSGKAEGRKTAPSRRKTAILARSTRQIPTRPFAVPAPMSADPEILPLAQNGVCIVSTSGRKHSPLISIVVLTRNGMALIDTLFRSFSRWNTYQNFEFLVVDHASTDHTIELIQKWQDVLPIRLFPFDDNYSFSYSNNFAVKQAAGDCILLLNNDIEFASDLLFDLVEVLEDERVGAVGVRQHARADGEGERRFQSPFHLGTRFEWNREFRFLQPVNVAHSLRDSLLAQSCSEFPAVNGALLLCRKTEYLELGGLDESYFYGYEDVDFCCKIRSKLKKKIVSLNSQYVIHDESTTRDKQKKSSLSDQRKANIQSLKERYGYHLRRELLHRLPDDDGSYFGRRLSVGFAVTTDKFESGAGDLYTAWGLGEALKRLYSWNVQYIPIDSWYDEAEIDIYFAMRHDFDLRKLKKNTPHAVVVAWMRNWLERWIDNPCFEDFGMHLCSSEFGSSYINEKKHISSIVFPIAVAKELFGPGVSVAKYECDYLFTGNYWQADIPREIESFDPANCPHKFGLYGRNWDKHASLSQYHRGFVDYSEMPKLYNSAPVTIDDTVTHVTKLWGSLNSRIFEALACGSLVLTNNEIGSREFFDGKLPVWHDADSLSGLVDHYVVNVEEREQLTSELRDKVFAKHTFDHRAQLFRQVFPLSEHHYRISIKCPVPNWSEAEAWGDYHFARSLQRALIRLGHRVRLDILPEWYCDAAMGDDVAIVLRGLSKYKPSPDQINFCWLISHPDSCEIDELEHYDHVFVASLPYTDTLRKKLSTSVSALLQCSDPYLFDRSSSAEEVPSHPILFVGNSRKMMRHSIAAAIEANLTVEVYGRDWGNLIPDEMVAGEHIPNSILYEYYRRADIVLNDHWPDMAKEGFLSNRLFDVALAGGFVISDVVAGDDVFDGLIPTFQDAAELAATVDLWKSDSKGRSERTVLLSDLVRQNHTFDCRAGEIIDFVNKAHALKRQTDDMAILAGN